MAYFLPYNPNILAFTDHIETGLKCAEWWPKGTFCTSDQNKNHKWDFLWIDSDGLELDILHNCSDILKEATAIYTTTHFFDEGIYFKNLQFLLELSEFKLLSHWYWETDKGEALFIKKDIFNAMMRSLNYLPQEPRFQQGSSFTYDLTRFFHRAEHKAPQHKMDEIDYIYMINLDERPEKFAQASKALLSFGISPYRFSAVNGWKLPFATLGMIGARFLPGMMQEKFMGSVFREIDGEEFCNHELIQENGTPYFSLGISRGAIGMVLSHLSVLQDAYDSGYNTIWVMEDDVEALEDPKEIPGLIRDLDRLVDDWDILFTDTDTKDRHGNHVPCRALAARPNFNMEMLPSFLSRFYAINSDFSRIGMRYGSYSMIIRRTGMKKILNYFKTYGLFLPYDMDYWLIPDLKLYCVNRDIISHRADAPSDNSVPGYKE